MERKKLFKKYRNKLIVEALIKSAICGFAIGLFASIIPAIITLKYNANGLWYCLAVIFGVGLIATAVFYFVSFRPTQLQVAGRIDRLGLKERAITMMELEGNDSFMAEMQRKDAQECISATSSKKLKFNIFKIPLIILAVAFVCAIPLIPISAASVESPKLYISNAWHDETETPKDAELVTVTYLIYQGVGGDILDYAVQEIPAGSDAHPVEAVAWPGYGFIGWQTEDGDLLFTLDRADKRVMKDLTAYAVFMMTGEGDPNLPNKEEERNVRDVNTVGDGMTYYGADFESDYKKVKEFLSNSGDSLTQEQRTLIETYFQTMDRLK